MKTGLKQLILLIALGLSTHAISTFAADANRGKRVFEEECAECHSVKEGKNKKGPSLWNVLGRKSASIADFNYSDSMKNSGIVWTTDKIAAYLAHPKQVVPAGKMKYEGLESDSDREDLIAFIASLH